MVGIGRLRDRCGPPEQVPSRPAGFRSATGSAAQGRCPPPPPTQRCLRPLSAKSTPRIGRIPPILLAGGLPTQFPAWKIGLIRHDQRLTLILGNRDARTMTTKQKRNTGVTNMYMNETHRARSSQLPREFERDSEIESPKDPCTWSGPDGAEVDEADMVSVFGTCGGVMWTALTSGGVSKVYCRQLAFAIQPKWTFVPDDSVPEDVRSRIFA